MVMYAIYYVDCRYYIWCICFSINGHNRDKDKISIMYKFINK